MELAWLEQAGPDFAERRRALTELPDEDFAFEARRLATLRLSNAQAAALGRDIARRIRAGAILPGLSPLRLLVLSGTTFGLLFEPMVTAAARHGVALDVIDGGYDQVEQGAFDASGVAATTNPDATLVAVDHRWLRLDRPALNNARGAVEAALARVEGVVQGLAANGGGSAILCTAPRPPEGLFGNFDVRAPGSPAAMVALYNAGLEGVVQTHSGTLFDVAGLASRVGSDAWFDPVVWHGAKLAFSPSVDALYCDYLARLLGAMRGRARKALVLDLDNTLWGGVLGDDGPSGLSLGPGDPLGEAFDAVQDYAISLHERGVFLAVSSKNDQETARRAFGEVPGMRLKLEHIAVFRADWTDKASHLRDIAERLHIGLDALVLLDDNPAERAFVRATLPEVAVPELPSDPSLFVRRVASAGYFEAVGFSNEDAGRASEHRQEAERAVMRAGAVGLNDYLYGLQMGLTVSPFRESDRARVAQLINKTNQFNLTTRRRTEAEVALLEKDSTTLTLQAHLADRFGEMGLISVLIAQDCKFDGQSALKIDTWLMSCRVLGRKVEDAMFGAARELALARGAKWLIGDYIPTAKNQPVADLLPRMGFSLSEETNDRRTYCLAVDEAATRSVPMAVRFDA